MKALGFAQRFHQNIMPLRGAERRGNLVVRISNYEIATPPSSARNDIMDSITLLHASHDGLVSCFHHSLFKTHSFKKLTIPKFLLT